MSPINGRCLPATRICARSSSKSESGARREGLFNTPHNAFSLWTTYDVTQKWTVGGGAFFVDAVWGNLDALGNTTRVPSYWRFDLMTSYKITNNIVAQLNIYNLTNEYYFAQVYNNWAVPGAGRSAALTLRGRW